jgi:hypothetical protein
LATFLRSFFSGTAAKAMRSGHEKPFRLTSARENALEL